MRYGHFFAGGTQVKSLVPDDYIHTSSQAEVTSLLPVATRCRGLAACHVQSPQRTCLVLAAPLLPRLPLPWEVNARHGANDILLGIAGEGRLGRAVAQNGTE